MQFLLRALLALALLALAAVCVFRFLTSGQAAWARQRLAWRIGYPVGGLASLGGATSVARQR